MEKTAIESQISHSPIYIGTNSKITLKEIKRFTDEKPKIALNKNAYEKIHASQQFLESYLAKRIPIYGSTTQFGDQACLLDKELKSDSNIYSQSINERQVNLIRSHTCGMGNPMPSEMVKVAMLLRAHCLAQGYSGVHVNVIETYLSCLNADLIPIVPKFGSIGASGDLIPLASIAAALIGEQVPVQFKNIPMSAPEALKLANIQPLSPKMRDGLAMINGTSFMAAVASVSLNTLQRLFNQMLSSIAMALESLLVISSPFDPLVHTLKGHSGQMAVSQFLMEFWKGSRLLIDLNKLENDLSHQNSTKDKDRVQDYYSLRAVAQGFGPFNENIEKAILWIENEMNSVNDNPIVDIQDKRLINNANFMGYYITDACDILKINIAQASTSLHALLANLVHPRKNSHLPANLVEDPATHNGFRPIQLLAASLAVQNRKLAQAQQAYSLPTEGDNQDVNSLGMHAALDFYDAVQNLERLTAILLLAAVQALEIRGIQKASVKAQHVFQKVRALSPTIGKCRVLQDELKTITQLLKSETI